MQLIKVPIRHAGTGVGGRGDGATDPPQIHPLKSAASLPVIVQTVCSGGGLETRALSPRFPGCALKSLHQICIGAHTHF